MIREIIARLKTKATRVVRAVIAKLGAALRKILPLTPAAAGFSGLVVSAEDAMDAGKRYRLTSGHAPIFSLFTFFGLRQ